MKNKRYVGFVAMVSCLLITAAHGSVIKVDNSASFAPTNDNPGTLSGFAVDGANKYRMLVVAVAGEYGSTIDGITYGGVALTQSADIIQSGGSGVSIWTLTTPPGGTGDIVVDFNDTGYFNGYTFVAISIYGDGVLSVIDSGTAGADSGTSASVSLSNVAAGDFVLGVGEGNANSSISSDLATTLYSVYSHGLGDWNAAFDYTASATGAKTINWSIGNQRHAVAAIGIRWSAPVGTVVSIR